MTPLWIAESLHEHIQNMLWRKDIGEELVKWVQVHLVCHMAADLFLGLGLSQI